MGEAMTLDLNRAPKGQIAMVLRLPPQTQTRNQVARVLRREIRKRTPVVTGVLRRSLRIQLLKSRGSRSAGKGQLRFRIVYVAPYAFYPYRYHKKRGNDWIRKAIKASRRKLERGRGQTPLRGSRTRGPAGGRGG